MRGLALWILSKFAMLFFIFALAAILLQMSVMQQKSACGPQASDSVDSITSKVSQVIFSPSEDERQTYSLINDIPVGDNYELYEINITFRKSQDQDRLEIDLGSLSDASCTDGKYISLGASGYYTVVFVSPNGPVKAQPGSMLHLTPSAAMDPATLPKSMYVIILKCSQKAANGKKYLFIQDCHKASLADCTDLNFDADTIQNCCGWGGGTCQFG